MIVAKMIQGADQGVGIVWRSLLSGRGNRQTIYLFQVQYSAESIL